MPAIKFKAGDQVIYRFAGSSIRTTIKHMRRDGRAHLVHRNVYASPESLQLVNQTSEDDFKPGISHAGKVIRDCIDRCSGLSTKESAAAFAALATLSEYFQAHQAEAKAHYDCAYSELMGE